MHHGRVPAKIAKGLLELRRRIEAANIPSSKVDETLNIATWNVRELGTRPRSEAAVHYIAEIMGQFDLISLVELQANLTDLRRVLEIMGPYWKAIFSDMIADPGGDRERLCFVFDTRTVRFNGLAAEANEPRTKKGDEYLSEVSFWRPPYMASFKSGNFDFVAMSIHIRSTTRKGSRTRELERLAKWVDEKRKEKHAEDQDLLLMGDFNIPSITSPEYAAIQKYKLQIPPPLAKLDHGSNLKKNKRYDQILHRPLYPATFSEIGGVLDFFIDDAHIRPLFGNITRDAFTYEMSDHLPLWMQLRTDIDGFELQQIIQDR